VVTIEGGAGIGKSTPVWERLPEEPG